MCWNLFRNMDIYEDVIEYELTGDPLVCPYA